MQNNYVKMCTLYKIMVLIALDKDISESMQPNTVKNVTIMLYKFNYFL